MADDREEHKNTLEVMSMVGPVGVGKTALAMEVYRQLQQIQGHHFQCCATAKVSHRPDMKELLKHILSQIVDESEALAPDSSIQPSQITTLQQEQELLVCKISQCLQDKRYLVVIDNIRKESDWDIIKNAFPQNNKGSRIIVTTQLGSLAQVCSSHSANGLVHEVKPLSRPDSERLLFRKAFVQNNCPPDNLKQVCDEILRRCEGIPLFITGMADWLLEEQKAMQHISMETIPKLPKQIQQALGNTCYDLTCLPKALLMYMSMFREGHLFEKDSLILKCRFSQGVFPKDAERCLSELVDRNVITRSVADSGNNPRMEENRHWHISYFMQQFLISKSADLELAFTSSTLTQTALTSVVPQPQGGKKQGRWLFLHQPVPRLPTLLGEMDLSHTRSLAISGIVDGVSLEKFTHLVMLDLEGWQCVKDEDTLKICKMFLLQYLSLRKTTGISKLPPEIKELHLLRILDISHTSICELPPEIKELHLLRMLDISHTSICEFPSQVCELKLLETLDLRSTPVRQLPERIGNIIKLKCLLINGGVKCDETATEIPKKVRLPIHLEKLATVDLSGCSPSLVGALGGLERLRELAITWSLHQCTDNRFHKALLSSFEKWKHLESLTIHCGLGCCMDFLAPLPPRLPDHLQKFKVSGGRFDRIPKRFVRLKNLTFIEITICRLEPKEDLSILGNLPELEHLVLGLHFIPEAAIVIDEIGFDQLKRFSVSCRVPWLTFKIGAMQKLTSLQLKIVGNLASQESVPSGIYNLKSLSEVAIRYDAGYTNSPNVKRTVEAVRKEISDHRMPINLFIEEEDVETARESTSQNEIKAEE